MKKSLFCLFLALALVCMASAPVRAETVRKIGVSVGRMSDEETKAFCDMLQAYFAGLETADTKYELFFADAQGSPERQKAHIDSLLKQKLKLIVINFLDSAVVEAAAETLESAATPALLFGRQMIVRSGSEYTAHSSVDALLDRITGCYVGGDLRQASLRQGEILAARPHHGDTNQDGVIHYVIIRDNAPQAESRMRTDLSLRAAGNAGLEAVCLADRSGAADRAQAKAICEKLFQDFGAQIEAVICTHDEIAIGAAQAAQEAGDAVNAAVCVLGMDGTDEAVQLARQNKIAGTVVIDGQAQERMAQEAILKILNGETIQKYYWTEYQTVVGTDSAATAD